MQALLGSYPNLRILEASVEDLAISSLQQGQQQQGRQHRIDGVLTKEGHSVTTGQIVITTGTFLRGMCYLGRTRYSAGRHMRSSDGVEPPSVGLALTLERLAFPLARLKTGTPPRLLRSTIDWDSLEKQGSDLPPPCFSYLNIDRYEHVYICSLLIRPLCLTSYEPSPQPSPHLKRRKDGGQPHRVREDLHQ